VLVRDIRTPFLKINFERILFFYPQSDAAGGEHGKRGPDVRYGRSRGSGGWLNVAYGPRTPLSNFSFALFMESEFEFIS